MSGPSGRIGEWLRIAIPILVMAASALASPVRAAAHDTVDIFIGTLAKEENELVLTRCDLGESRYLLIDAPNTSAVATARNGALPAYGEVIGSYFEKHGHAMLKVESIGHLTPGRDCHLIDAATRMFEGPHPPSSNPEALRARLADSLMMATQKYSDGDYTGTLAILRQSQTATVTEEKTATDFLTRVGFAMIEVAYGDTLNAGHLGDACPHYAAARAKDLTIQAMAASSTDDHYRTVAKDVFDRIEKGETRAACETTNTGGDADAAFAGHYYLSGVRETGSELLLDTNGSFQWLMTYGAVDQSAQGRWHRDGGAIVLVAAMPATNKPLFSYLKTGPWTLEAEQDVLQGKYDAMAESVRETCPFLTDNWVATPPAAMPDDGSPKPSALVLRQQAGIALAKAISARTRVEALAREVMSQGADRQDRGNGADRVQQTLSDWLNAKGQAGRTARAAGMTDPQLKDPTLPASCTIPPMQVASDGASGWTGGIAARVFDQVSEQGARNVQVLLHFADGHQEKLVTSRSGLAIRPVKAAKAVIGATLHADYAKGRDATFTFAPVTSGILHFSIDAPQLAGPPFATLRLTIADKALIAEEFGKGRYERQP